MSLSPSTLLLALGLGLLAAVGAYGLRCASVGGAAALGIQVALIAAVAGWPWGIMPLTYVVAQIVLSRFRRAQKGALSDASRRGQRITWQGAVSRLGWAALLTALPRTDSPWGYAALVGCVAASTADLASTQLGLLSAQHPRIITTWLPVRTGTPGAISLLGTLAAVGAAWLVGLLGLLTQAVKSWSDDLFLAPIWLWLPAAALAGGMAGALVDSLLAATAQRVYYDPRRQEITAYEADADGAPNEPVRGWVWLTDEAIDAVATVVGAAVTGVLVFWLAHSMGQW